MADTRDLPRPSDRALVLIAQQLNYEDKYRHSRPYAPVGANPCQWLFDDPDVAEWLTAMEKTGLVGRVLPPGGS